MKVGKNPRDDGQSTEDQHTHTLGLINDNVKILVLEVIYDNGNFAHDCLDDDTAFSTNVRTLKDVMMMIRMTYQAQV